MKTNRVICLSLTFIGLAFLCSFTPPNPLPNANFTVSLSNMPVQGNTEYILSVSYASGNNAYEVRNYTGFYFLTTNGWAQDVVPNQNTNFHIKTYPNVTHIAGTVYARSCVPSPCQDSGSKGFGF